MAPLFSAPSQVTSVKELIGLICQICGDEIEVTADGKPFVACNECSFPVCRAYYEYERREENQARPGVPELMVMKKRRNLMVSIMSLNTGTMTINTSQRKHSLLTLVLAMGTNEMLLRSLPLVTYIPSLKSRIPDVPLLTYDQDSKRIPPRPMDPKKDLAVYGCTTVAWKDRMEEWKKRQNERRQVVNMKDMVEMILMVLIYPSRLDSERTRYIPLSPILEGYIILKEILDYCDDNLDFFGDILIASLGTDTMSHQDAANWRNRSFPHFDMLKIEEATNKFSQALGVDLDIAQKRDQINDGLRKLSKISVLQRHKALLAIAHDQAMNRLLVSLP
ncbi:hypothetical protein C3L33_18238, partial [Rhododendron williamsianum]